MTTRRKSRVKLIRVNLTATIRRQSDEVFAYLVNAESMPRWQWATVRAWYTPEGLPEVGAHLHVVTINRKLGRATESDWTVTEYQSGTVMTLEGIYGPYRFRTRYQVVPAAEGGAKLRSCFSSYGVATRQKPPVVEGSTGGTRLSSGVLHHSGDHTPGMPGHSLAT
jgi:hypothetical protein